MVKHSEQANSCISSRKRVSFDVGCKSDDYSPADERKPSVGVSHLLHSDEIERFMKVVQSLTVARMDAVERFAELSKTTNTERSEKFKSSKRILKDVNLYQHQNLENSTHLTRYTSIRQKDASPVEFAKGLSVYQVDSCKQSELASSVAKPSQHAVDSVKCPSEIDRKLSALRVNSVEGLADEDVQSSSESTATDDTGSGNSSRRGSGDSLHEPYRGYSNQRRHGRKDSLGTVDFTKLIPTLVSDNEDFRHKEYQRQLSVQPIELRQNTW